MSTHYQVMGLSPNATSEEIADQYRALAKVLHPDMGGDTVMFQVLQDAYDVIGDPALRAAYDRSLRTAELRDLGRQRPVPGREAPAPDGRWIKPSTPEQRAHGAWLAERGILSVHQTAEQRRRARGKDLRRRIVVVVLVLVGTQVVNAIRGCQDRQTVPPTLPAEAWTDTQHMTR